MNKTNPIKLAAVIVAAAVVSGCISAQTREVVEPAAEEPAAPIVPEPVASSSWTVAVGEHLWGIAGDWDVFNVPEKWPLLYKANLDQIEDADLIFPGQVLSIPRDSTLGEVDAAIRHAKTRGAWAVGPVELADKEYLKNSE